MNFTYIPVDRIFTKLRRDYSLELPEGDVIEWVGEALEAIQTSKEYEEAVAFIEVKNYICQLPTYTRAIIQIARDMDWSPSTRDELCPSKVIAEKTVESGASVPVPLDCHGSPITDYEVAYYRPYFDIQYKFSVWGNSSWYNRQYVPVRLEDNSLYNTLVCKLNDGNNVLGNDTYRLIGGVNKALRFSFKEGSIAVSFTRQRLDEVTGYPLIPDGNSHIEAICCYIMWRVSKRDFYNGRAGADARMVKAEEQWHWYCGQAKNKARIPSGIDEHQNIANSSNYLLPRRNLYDNFFGNLNVAEYRGYLDPDRRNNNSSLI